MYGPRRIGQESSMEGSIAGFDAGSGCNGDWGLAALAEGVH